MKRRVASWTQHLGKDGNWNTEVRLDDGSEFHDMIPGLQCGEELEISSSGTVTVRTEDGSPFSFNPTWVRAPVPPVGLQDVSGERELHLRPLAAKIYSDFKLQDAWIQGCAWNGDGAKPRQMVAEAFEAGPEREAALAGWDFVETRRRRDEK